ncbi:DUF4267 domain-containing protein [Chitinophaga ginsengisoli]|uniref:Uncharacterized protein DUF4267 n=1 Tax=Chitinophaga ginsengisoli TaxID=363837 RepID=A0A2P8FMT2_9BACT|nr:DUF4267 domain-containing protein [Chitinophaga ginsengisoli]PSL23048.1 uncharacterized protein DUF4267 [Chitinophaga ginsengisoli]
MKKTNAVIAFGLTFITGALLIFIGARFLLLPDVAEHAFGIQTVTGNDFAFHYIKGIRDLSAGMAILALLLTRTQRGLAILLLTASLVPVADFLIVLHAPGHLTAQLYPHVTAIVLGLVLGCYYLFTAPKSVTHVAL